MFKRKSLEVLNAELESHDRLNRVLGPVSLTALGVGTIIGAGIFVIVGKVAADTTGPAIVVSFMVAGLACIFAALCYAEFAAMVPVAGSAYTYAYATLGELFAWIIGWDLILEYTVASATVAHGWSHYFQDFLTGFGIHLPEILTKAPFDQDPTGGFLVTGGIIDLPAMAVTAILTVILVLGIRESAGVNAGIVILKVAVVLFVICVGAFYVTPSNWSPVAPYGWAGLSFFGDAFVWGAGPDGKPIGMLAGAGMIFFAYIGFDAVSTHAEEARNPQRDVPIGILASLFLCTALYILVAAVLTGMVKYDQISTDAPVAKAFAAVGQDWARYLVSVGAIAGITSVLMVLMLSQSRVLMAMARDGLLPQRFFAAVHPKFLTPWKSTILTGLAVMILSAVIPLRVLLELVNIGTLLAFVIVCIATLVMRYLHPEFPRPFRVPALPFVSIMGAALCLMLMLSLPGENWLRLLVWLMIGFGIYFFFGRRNAERVRQERGH